MNHKVRITHEIIARERAALDRWGRGDPSGYLEIYSPDVTYFDDTLERRLDGLEALTRLFEKVRGKIHLTRCELLRPKVQLCGEAAVLTYNFVGEAGGQTDHWHCTQVYLRTPKGWRIIQTHWSVARAAPVKPPPTAKAKRSSNQNIVIRPAELADLGAITEIYNEAILHTTATFDTEPQSLSERLEWFQAHTQRYRILVAELDGQVVGWASLSQWSERHAYDDTAETSFYVKAGRRGQGIGRKLKQAIIEEARRLHFHTLIARVAAGSEASLHLNEEFGFVRVGTLKEVGRKFGRLLDVHLLQKMLDWKTSW